MIRRAVGIIALAVAAHVYAKPLAVSNDDSAADRAVAITKKYQLTQDNIECLQFETFNKGAYYLVRVREIHPKACGGMPDVSPTLFFLKIRKSDGHALTNVYDGEHFVPPRRVTKK